MSAAPPTPAEIPEAGPGPAGVPARVALLGNPNTGKTTLFNRLSGLRHKTSNFPGTTQEARVGELLPGDGAAATEIIDLPGIYSLELDQGEAEICRAVLAGRLAPKGEEAAEPDAVCVVTDATNLARNLVLVGEALRRRLPTVVAVNMIDLARKRGLHIDAARLSEVLGCAVVLISARTGEGIETLRQELAAPRVPNRTPPGQQEQLERWADEVYAAAASASGVAGNGDGPAAFRPADSLTDRLDRVFTHPVTGLAVFAAVSVGLFYALFSLAAYPMDLIDAVFAEAAKWVVHTLPAGVLTDLLANGVISGIGATVIFLPQICLLFFVICILEDTGYLARAAFVMDRVLRPFGLPGHAFVPLLSSHACALPGIMACRAIPDRRDRLATILVAPFMTCSARLPVYVLVTMLLFRDRPALAALAFVGCYALGIAAGLLSALAARRTILRGRSRPMALELPTYKLPSLRTALLTTYDRAMVFLKNAGTNILAICIVLWWLGSYPHVPPPARVVELRQQAAQVEPADSPAAAALAGEADALEASHAKANSFAGRMGRAIQPVFGPLGYDWQLTVGVVTSFAAREVFVSTMAVVITGSEEAEDEGVLAAVGAARRDDGVTPVFTTATCWSLLVYYVLAMQCLPTLAVTAKEAGGLRWAALQLAWMSVLAYALALITYQGLRAAGIA
ncbi:MAG: ferrous iron transporter B [Phycisphaerales bacterium]|nr:ferrous iron transporter B [Phycisphaerales bacterium]